VTQLVSQVSPSSRENDWSQVAESAVMSFHVNLLVVVAPAVPVSRAREYQIGLDCAKIGLDCATDTCR
jgi:hypothetical protein